MSAFHQPSCTCKPRMAALVYGCPQLTPLNCLTLSQHRLQQPAQSLGACQVRVWSKLYHLHGCRSAPETRHRLQQAGQGLGEQAEHSDDETHPEDDRSPESDSNEAPSAEGSGAESQLTTPETTPHTTPQRHAQQRWASQGFAEGCRGLAVYVTPAKRTGLSPRRSRLREGEIAAQEMPYHAVRRTWGLCCLRSSLAPPLYYTMSEIMFHRTVPRSCHKGDLPCKGLEEALLCVKTCRCAAEGDLQPCCIKRPHDAWLPKQLRRAELGIQQYCRGPDTCRRVLRRTTSHTDGPRRSCQVSKSHHSRPSSSARVLRHAPAAHQ